MEEPHLDVASYSSSSPIGRKVVHSVTHLARAASKVNKTADVTITTTVAGYHGHGHHEQLLLLFFFSLAPASFFNFFSIVFLVGAVQFKKKTYGASVKQAILKKNFSLSPFFHSHCQCTYEYVQTTLKQLYQVGHAILSGRSTQACFVRPYEHSFVRLANSVSGLDFFILYAAPTNTAEGRFYYVLYYTSESYMYVHLRASGMCTYIKKCFELNEDSILGRPPTQLDNSTRTRCVI